MFPVLEYPNMMDGVFKQFISRNDILICLKKRVNTSVEWRAKLRAGKTAQASAMKCFFETEDSDQL